MLSEFLVGSHLISAALFLAKVLTGQDDSYLAEFLLEKGYEVHGVKRQSPLFDTPPTLMRWVHYAS